MGEIRFPKFKLVQVQAEPPKVSAAVPLYLDGEINGDKIPDRMELIQEGRKIGFRLKLGAYQKVAPTVATKTNPLFGPVAAMLSFTSRVIWQTVSPRVGENGVPHVEQFEMSDFNADGDLDIRFSVKRQLPDGFVVGIYVLMNQTISDPELASIEEVVPPPEEGQPSPTPEHRRRDDGDPTKLGFNR